MHVVNLKTTFIMKNIFIFLFVAAIAAVACNKDKFQTAPQITIKSVNTKEVPYNGTLVVNLQYTDKEGDVSDSLFVLRERLNKKGPFKAAILPNDIPTFPNTSKGEIQVSFAFQTALTAGISSIRIPGTNPSRYEPDTMVLKFVVRDKAGHASDTAVLNDIIVTRL